MCHIHIHLSTGDRSAQVVMVWNGYTWIPKAKFQELLKLLMDFRVDVAVLGLLSCMEL